MSVLQFLPPQNFFVNHIDYVWQYDVFSNEELNRIESVGDTLNQEEGGMIEKEFGETRYHQDFRKCKIAWMERNSDTEFVYQRLADYVTYANARFFDFNLFGFVEDFQYTVYDHTNSHCDWHVDIPKKGAVHYRKLSVILQLSAPEDYEGGSLELLTSAQPTVLEKKRGIVHVFPSYMVHRVTPVTKGIRKTLVAWVNGERFR